MTPVGMNKAFILGLESRSISYDVTKQNLRDTATQSAGYGCFGELVSFDYYDPLSPYLIYL